MEERRVGTWDSGVEGKNPRAEAQIPVYGLEKGSHRERN